MNQAHFVAPTRARPFAKAKLHTPVWLRVMLGRELSPSQEEYERAVSALTDGDQPMDTLLDWIFAEDTRQRKAQFHGVLQQGVAELTTSPEPIQQFFRTLETPPAWIDFELMEEAVRFIHGLGLNAGYVLRDLALMGGYLLSGFNQSLVMTGALNKGTTAQRIAETGKWWIDCTEPRGLEPFAPGYQSTLHVRMVHGLVRRNLAKRPDWDHSHWGLPINQIDMVATYLGFSVVMILGLRKLGIPVLPRESKAVIHLWSYACWLMGVEEQWLVQSETEGLVLLNHTYMTQSQPDATSRELARSLAEEPLQRSYHRFQSVRRKLAYQQHLGMSQYFLGHKKMQQLGFEQPGIPWYPLASLVPRAVTYSVEHFTPGLRARQQRKGREEQLAMLASMFGDQDQRLIHPDNNHPAHV